MPDNINSANNNNIDSNSKVNPDHLPLPDGTIPFEEELQTIISDLGNTTSTTPASSVNAPIQTLPAGFLNNITIPPEIQETLTGPEEDLINNETLQTWIMGELGL